MSDDIVNEVESVANVIGELSPAAQAYIKTAEGAIGLATSAITGLKAVFAGQSPAQQAQDLSSQHQALASDIAQLKAMAAGSSTT